MPYNNYMQFNSTLKLKMSSISVRIMLLKQLDCFRFLVEPDPDQNQPISGSKLVLKFKNRGLGPVSTFWNQNHFMNYAGYFIIRL